MSLLGDIAARWLADEEAEDTDEAFADVKQAKKARTVAEAVADAATSTGGGQITDEQALELSTALWAYADVGATKFLGPGYATTAEEKELLIKATVPVAKEYVPVDFASGGLKNLIPIELVFLGVVALVYLPKHQAAKAAKAAAAAAAAGPQPEREVQGDVTSRSIRAVS